MTPDTSSTPHTVALAVIHDRMRGTSGASVAHVCPSCADGSCAKTRVCAMCDGTRRVVSLRNYDRLLRTAKIAAALAESMVKGDA